MSLCENAWLGGLGQAGSDITSHWPRRSGWFGTLIEGIRSDFNKFAKKDLQLGCI